MDDFETRAKRAQERIMKIMEEEEVQLVPQMNPSFQIIDTHKSPIISPIQD